MRNILTIARREVKAYFASWMAYATIPGFIVISSYIFFVILTQNKQDVRLQWVFSNMAVTFLFMTPLITMRLLAEEKNTGTIELLLTAPVTDWQVVLGKYFGALSVFIAIFALTLIYPLTIEHYANPDRGPILAGYLGILLVVCCYVSVGLFSSSVTDSQVVAGFMGFGILLGFWIVHWVSSSLNNFWGEFLKTIAIVPHLEDYTEGLVDTKHLVYQLSFIFFWLYCSVRILESRKWR